ncbi:MAG: 50S ribosomal protein L23 [Flavobacteriaceae bacterium]|nr:MAG: 50S ribosomal protein L23 [Flavobacteriaceae bacterium]
MGILIRPLITEKATNLSEVQNRFTFLVNPSANKIEIKKAIEQTYGVTIKEVRTMISRPKVKTKFTKNGLQVGKTNKLKKAIVEVENGQVIDLYGNL